MAHQDSINKLLAWFKANDGFLHEAVEMRHDDKYGYHFVAIAPLPEGTKVCECPKTLALSHINPKSDISEMLADKLLVEERVAFSIMEQKLKGTDSLWAPYLEVLPKEDELTTTQFFEKADLVWLKGTNMYSSAVPEERTAVMIRKQQSRSCYNEAMEIFKARGVDSSKYTYKLFMWAITVLTSRCFPSSLMYMDHPANGDEYPLLYPVMDHFNHRFSEKVVWSTGDGNFGLILSAEVNSGDQIFNNYAPKGNEELLMGYGFCEPNNPCDEVAVLLACPPQQLHLALKRAHPEHFVAPGWTDAEAGFFIRGSGHFSGGYDNPWPALPCLRFIPPMLVRTIRTMTGETFELEGDNAKEKDAMLWFATLDTLASRMKSKTEAIRRFDKKLKKPKNKKQEYAKIYRNGQLKILEEVWDALNEIIEPIELGDMDPTEAFAAVI